jgi:uncharacterized protein YunC (DUF1805 family)
MKENNSMHSKIDLGGKQADGYVIPIGPINLVFIITSKGMLGCGAIDVAALNNFSYPAAKAKSKTGAPIATIEDLLEGTVKEANAEAAKLGISAGMSCKEALYLL